MATYATLTVPVRDVIGADFNESRASVWIEPNTPDGLILADGIRVGGRREQLVGGTATFANLVTTNSADNPTSFGYRVTISAPPKGASKREDMIVLTTSDFPLTGNASLVDIEEAWDNITAPPSWRSDFRDEMNNIAGVAASSATSAAASASFAGELVLSDLGTTDGQTRALVDLKSSQTYGALSGDFAGRGTGTSSTLGSLPNLATALRTYNDATAPTVRVVSLGSSVGNGAGLAADNPAVNAPAAYLYWALDAVLNRAGNVDLTFHNGSVDGSSIGEATVSGEHYAAAKTAAGGLPTLVPLVYGMNDGGVAQYHAGQTYPNIYTWGKTLIQEIRADGADPLLFTSPHPHTGRNGWDMPDGVAVTYPAAGTQVPGPTELESVVMVTAPSGEQVPADVRFLRVNAAIRQLGADLGVPVIDVEGHWFDAVARYGEDALYAPGEVVHPNLLGNQESYHRGVQDFVQGLSRSTVIATRIPASANLGSWTAPTGFQNTWTNKGGAQDDPITYRIDPATGYVSWRGSMIGGVNGTIAFTVPPAARPDKVRIITGQAITDPGDTAVAMYAVMTAAGECFVYRGTSGAVVTFSGGYYLT